MEHVNMVMKESQTIKKKLGIHCKLDETFRIIMHCTLICLTCQPTEVMFDLLAIITCSMSHIIVASVRIKLAICQHFYKPMLS